MGMLRSDDVLRFDDGGVRIPGGSCCLIFDVAGDAILVACKSSFSSSSARLMIAKSCK